MMSIFSVADTQKNAMTECLRRGNTLYPCIQEDNGYTEFTSMDWKKYSYVDKLKPGHCPGCAAQIYDNLMATRQCKQLLSIFNNQPIKNGQ